MKSTRLAVVVVLIALCAISWMMLAKNLGKGAGQAAEHTQQAAQYQQRRLYQLAVDEYRLAIEAEPSKERYNALIETCRAYLAEDPASDADDALLEAYSGAVRQYPDDVGYWENYIRLYVDDEDYAKANSALRQADSAGVESEALESLRYTIRYSYKRNYEAYEQISLREEQDVYVVATGGLYGAVEADGGDRARMEYSYVGPVGEDGVILCVTQEGETQLFDADGVMVARFSAAVEQAMGCAEGLIPVRLAGRSDWCYLDYEGNEICGGYLQAGRFQDGAAAVQTADGGWCLIDETGAPVDGTVWEQIRLDETGRYIQDDVMLVKSDGTWKICDDKGQAVEGFSCEDIDCCYEGEPIAFCQGGLWGFADTDGTVLIQPAYEAARSFSDGVAAVRTGSGWNFIDQNGTLVIQADFANAGYFSPESGACPVQMDPDVEEWRLITWQIAR